MVSVCGRLVQRLEDPASPVGCAAASRGSLTAFRVTEASRHGGQMADLDQVLKKSRIESLNIRVFSSIGR